MLWQRSDAALVREVLGGRHEQFGLLVERHLPRVLAIAGARVQCRADADDAAQEAFLKAYISLDTLKDHTRFAPWLAAIVRNVCASLQRARREEPVELTSANEPAVEPEHETRELHAVLRREIDRLEPDTREVLLLHYFAGLKIREIAETLNISPAAAGKRLDRARDALGQQLIAQLGPALDLYKPREGQAKRLSAVVLAVRPAWPTVPLSAAAVATSFTGITILKAVIAGATLVAAAGLAAWQLEKPAAPSQPVSVAPASSAKEAAPPPPTAKITEAPAQPGDPQISGRVYDAATGEGIPGVKVAAEMLGQPRAESAPTNKDGYYAFDTLPEGRWMLQRGEARSYPFGKEIEKVAVNAAPARKITGVDFALRKGVLIRGHVLDPSGATVPKAYVHDEASGGNDVVKSDGEGRFELWVPEPGIAALRAYTAGDDVESVTRRGSTQTVPLQGLDGVKLIVHPYGRISGIVKNSAGQPMPSVSVNACVKESDGYKSFPSDTAVTNDTGTFEMTRLFEGTYMLKVEGVEVQEVTLDSGQRIQDLALAVDIPEPSTPAPKDGAMTISGRVLDPAGKPLAGVQVMASGEDESNRWSHGLSEMTGDDGLYKITGLLPGSHEVRAMCPPYAEAKRSAVASGSGGVELRLVEEPVLKGRMLRADSGEPITDFAICPTGRSESMFKGSDITADALPASSGLHFHDPAGAFTLKDTELARDLGSRLLVVQAEGFATQAVPIAPNATESGVETVVRLEPEARIEGIVVDSRGQPVPQAFIIPGRPLDISPEKLATLARACTDTEGRFVIGGLPRLDLTLSANHPKHPQAIAQATTIPGKTTNVRIALPDGTSLGGRVTYAGKPVNGSVHLNRPHYGTFDAETDADGRYHIDGLAPGEYSFWASLGNAKRVVPRKVYVTEGEQQEVSVDFPSGTSSLSGKVSLEGKTPLHFSVLLKLTNLNGDEESFFGSGVSDAKGIDGFGPDSYRFENLPAGEGEIDMSVYGENGESHKSSLHVSIADGQAHTLDFDFTGGATVMGTVNGLRPGEMSIVIAFPAELGIGPDDPIQDLDQNGDRRAKVPVMDGCYTIRGLDPGDYTLVAIAANPNAGDKKQVLATARKTLNNAHVEEGQTATVDFTLP